MRLPLRLHNFRPSHQARRPSYFSLIHQPVGSMDGFHTFASNRCGLSFSAFEVAAARSSPLAAMEKVTMTLTANPRNGALHPGGFFTAKSLGNARVRGQARRLLSLYEGFRSDGKCESRLLIDFACR